MNSTKIEPISLELSDGVKTSIKWNELAYENFKNSANRLLKIPKKYFGK